MDSQAALSSLQQAQSQAQDPNAILASQRTALGVDNAQQTVTGLRGAINNSTKLLQQVAPSIMGRTGSSLVTNAQATGQIANAQRPIAQNLSEQGSQYNEANSDLDRLEGRAGQAATGIYQGQQDKLSYAQNLYNTLYQKERDAQATQEAEANRQEQIRQFNEGMSLERSKANSAGGRSFDLGGGAAGPSIDPQQQQAATALTGLFKTNNVDTVAKTIRAITDSASRGNTYDKIKLQLLDSYKRNSPYASLINKALSAKPGLSVQAPRKQPTLSVR